MGNDVRQEPAPEAVLLLSIDEVHVSRIFAGAKVFELRKQLPRSGFQRVYLYQTGGSGVVGCFDAKAVLSGTIEDLWRRVGERATPRERFFRYFGGFPRGHAIEIAHVVQFDLPISLSALQSIDPSARAPVSSTRIPAEQDLFAFLEAVRADHVARPKLGVSLRPILDAEKSVYRDVVLQHIGRWYDDIDESFAASIISTHDAGFDSIGFFTEAKQVHGVVDGDGTLLGFTTTTLKGGGSVKTGPTILFPKFQGKGNGRETRAALERWAFSRGARKVYCTAPATSTAVVGYLLAADYVIEAHLRRQYAITHDELVFGKMLVPPSAPIGISKQGRSLTARVLKLEDVTARARLRRDLLRLLRGAWFPMPRETADRITEQLLSDENLPFADKPRRLIVLRSAERFVGGAVLLPKRGGAVKALFVTETTHGPSLDKLIRAAEETAKSLCGRKIFALHPFGDAALLRLLGTAGFLVEGILREPYRRGQDVCILSKPLAAGEELPQVSAPS